MLSITASVGNVLILIALRKGSSLHTPTKLLFRCLAVTDLLVGLILHPLHATGLVLDYLLKVTGHHVDDITFLVSFVFCGMSILISTAISVDRLLALLMMLKYKQVVTVRRVREAIVGFVLFVASIGLVYVFIGKIIALIITLILLGIHCSHLIHLLHNDLLPTATSSSVTRRNFNEHCKIQKDSLQHCLGAVGIGSLLCSFRY